MIYQFPYNMLHWLGRVLLAAVMSLLVGCVFWDDRTAQPQQQVSSLLDSYLTKNFFLIRWSHG